MLAVIEYLSTIEDPRDQEKIEYPLSSLIFISLCAIFCGAEGWDDIVLFADSRKKWLSNYIDMSNGMNLMDVVCVVVILHTVCQKQ
ncbi:transposase family protein [Legionella longbeachae]|uniref:transposase family protein n=1 Tax=Legionella longbeachae TaxID=450 RepID=UPI0009B7CA80|nr:hypothetical protein A6J40_04085 [Legionella longbeachae]VEE02293.1 Transposase IS4 family protein [Legionella oakridgensis]HBD7398214.1 transposase family protein [Legionella pneumophila]QIN32161.1 hypothetical protein GCB94_08400 [Legionella longbeachae]QIN35509.1 hypothetical protein GCS73_07640 [Legionella longbeachae]